MPTPKNIVGTMVVDKEGNKQQLLNLSNARRLTYQQYQALTTEQKKGVIIVPDAPDADIDASQVTYDETTVEDALDGKVSKSGDVMTGSLSITGGLTVTSSIDAGSHSSVSGDLHVNNYRAAGGATALEIGNSYPTGSKSYGQIILHGADRYGMSIITTEATDAVGIDSKEVTFPNKSGTVALTSDVTGLIKSDEYYGTTNANGLIALPNIYDSRTILKAEQKLEEYETIHRVVLVGKYTTQNVFKVCNTVDLTPAVSTNVTIKYYYI